MVMVASIKYYAVLRINTDQFLKTSSPGRTGIPFMNLIFCPFCIPERSRVSIKPPVKAIEAFVGKSSL